MKGVLKDILDFLLLMRSVWRRGLPSAKAIDLYLATIHS